jgi:hypothetical protein
VFPARTRAQRSLAFLAIFARTAADIVRFGAELLPALMRAQRSLAFCESFARTAADIRLGARVCRLALAGTAPLPSRPVRAAIAPVIPFNLCLKVDSSFFNAATMSMYPPGAVLNTVPVESSRKRKRDSWFLAQLLDFYGLQARCYRVPIVEFPHKMCQLWAVRFVAPGCIKVRI